MSTEARIGVVVGLVIVVVASVYFFYGSDGQQPDMLVSAGSQTPQPKIPQDADQKKPTLPAARTPAGVAASRAPGATPRPGVPSSAQPAAPTRPPVAPATPSGGPSSPPSNTDTLAKANTPASVGPPGVSSGGDRPAGDTTVASGPPWWQSRTDASADPSARPATPLRTGSSSELVEATRENLKPDAAKPDATGATPAGGTSSSGGASTPRMAGATPPGPTGPATPPTRRDQPAARPGATGATPATPSGATPATLPPAGAAASGGAAQPVPTGQPIVVKSAPKAAAWPKKHKIAEGDTLLAIADLYYGDGRMVSAILKANPRIKDPRALRIGDEITLEAPPASAKPAAGPAVAGAPARPGEAAKPAEPPKPAESASPPAEKTYQVREGDSFYSIAQSQLGSGGRWAELFRLNRELVKGDAKRLRPGMVLRLPVN